MKENICTIPVNEVFEVHDGCPICRMRDLIEAKYIDYITGPAMMEPDITGTPSCCPDPGKPSHRRA